MMQIKMKVKDILDMPCSLFKNVAESRIPVGNYTIGDFITCTNTKLKDRCLELKNEPKHSEKYDYIKKYLLPCATLSCTCNTRNRKDVIVRNPIIVLDIDFDEEKNENVFLKSKENKEKTKNYLVKELPYVCAADYSCSGTGLYAIVLLDSNNNDDELLEYYLALEEDFKELGIKLDPACKDIVRLRVISDSQPLLKEGEVTPYSKKKKVELKNRENTEQEIPTDHIIKRRVNTHRSFNKEGREETLKELLKELINSGYRTDDYMSWFNAMCFLKPIGDLGLELMIGISRISSGYTSDNDVICQWNKFESRYSQDDTYRYYYGISKKMLGEEKYRTILNKHRK